MYSTNFESFSIRGKDSITARNANPQPCRIWPLLGLSILSHLGLALFETVFVLYVQAKLGYGPAQVGIAFMVCGSVMGLFQGLAVGPLSGRVPEFVQLAFGFALMGLGIAALLLVRTPPLV